MLVFTLIFIINMLAADGLRSLMLMKLFPWASATYIHFLEYCDERFFDFGPWLLSVLYKGLLKLGGYTLHSPPEHTAS